MVQEYFITQQSNVKFTIVKIQKNEQNIKVLQAQRASLIAELSAAEAGLRHSENDLKATQLIAPREGTVVSRKVREGEYVSVGKSLFVIAPSDHLWIEANLKETQLSKLS